MFIECDYVAGGLERACLEVHRAVAASLERSSRCLTKLIAEDWQETR